MGNEIPLQLAQFFRAILLGSTWALLYDLTRALRAKGGRLWESLLDVLVSISAAASLFLFIMAEEGELRLFILLGAVGGAVLFFSLLSSALRPIWTFWVELFLTPLHLGDIFLRSLFLFSRKVFSFLWGWVTILKMPNKTAAGEEREHGEEAVKTENTAQQ